MITVEEADDVKQRGRLSDTLSAGRMLSDLLLFPGMLGGGSGCIIQRVCRSVERSVERSVSYCPRGGCPSPGSHPNGGPGPGGGPVSYGDGRGPCLCLATGTQDCPGARIRHQVGRCSENHPAFLLGTQDLPLVDKRTPCTHLFCSQVAPSGPRNRVVASDVEGFSPAAAATAAPAAAASTAAAAAAPAASTAAAVAGDGYVHTPECHSGRAI